MRLCNALIQYFLLISLSLFIYNCHGHEHHNHVDPVTTKYSESAATVDPLTKPIETANVQKNDFQQHNDDEHLHDTIDARLLAKHKLRQSVHQHGDDDKHENEQDYINQLNSALENEYKAEPHFQHETPPIPDTANNTASQNQTKQDAQQVPLQIQNETISSPITSIQTPTEQRQPASDKPSSIEAPTLDEKSNLKGIPDKIIAAVPVHINEQQPKDTIQQNVIKEDVLIIHKETIPSTQSQQQKETLNVVKPLTDHVPPSSNQQQPIPNTVTKNTLQDNSSLDIKSSSPTPSQQDLPQKPVSDSIQNVNSLDRKSDQKQPISAPTPTKTSSDLKLEQQQKPLSTPTPANTSSDLKLEQQQQPVSAPTPTNTSSDLKLEQQQQPVSAPTPTKTSPDLKLEQQQQPISASTPTKTSPDIKLEQQQQPVSASTPTKTSSDLKLEQQQQPVSASTPTKTSSDIKLEQQQQPVSAPTPTKTSPDLKLEQQQQPVSAPVPTNTSSDLQLEQQQKASDPIQNISSVDRNSSSPTPIKTDQEQQISNSTQNVNLTDQQQQPISETIQNISSIDHKIPSAQENQQPQVINTVKPTETVPTDVKSDDILSVPKESPTLIQTSPLPPTRVLRSATSRIQQNAQARQRHVRSKQQESDKTSSTENATIESILPTIEQPIEEHIHSIESSTLTLEELDHSIEPSTLEPEEPYVETSQNEPTIDVNINNETETEINDQNLRPIDTTDLPRQVHVHDTNKILNELKEDTDKTENLSLDEEIEHNTTVDSFLINEHSPHLPRILENEETISIIDSTMINTAETIETSTEIDLHLTQNDSKIEETNNTLTFKSNISDLISSDKYRQVCWRLPQPFEPSLGLIENQTLRFINLLPEFLQTIFFGRIDDREILMNRIWFGSICTMCFFFSFIFLSLGAKRLKQSKHEKEIRARCQQLQQYNNQIELERATFERQNQKLSDEIDELKNLPVRDADEEIFELREKYEHLHADWKIARTEHDALQRDIDYKQSLIQKHEFDMQKQVETVAYLNDEILRQKQELEKERETIARLHSNDLSLERFEKLQEIIHELKSEITQLKQDKFAQTDQLQQVQEHANQLDVDNNELTIKMKQLKDLLQQREQTIAHIKQKMLDDNDDDEEKTTEIGDILSTVTENNSNNNQQHELLSTIDNDVEKANQHMRDLHSEIEEKTRRIKELDSLVNQEKERCRELETKLKVVLELRERDAHLHIRQLGQTDAELRKARTDTERVRILQQQLEFKQQQLDDVQKVLSSEQMKFSEECSKLQHETHEKWMEVKRLTRELDGARKECEGLRRQITKYGNSDRSSHEKTMHKPVAQHMNNTSRVSSEPETNGSSPPTLPYQQGENFRPIDHERNDSGAASPSDMFRIRPPMFGLARPPFFPPPFMPPPNPFMMPPRFAMPGGGPHGMLSPIPHLMTNGSGGSDTNSFEIVDSTNITPNSTSYDAQFNGSTVSPIPDDEQQATAKTKKPKKSLKKKTKTSATTTVSGTKEDV